MAEAPEVTLNRALAQLLHDRGLALNETNPDGTLRERGIRLDGVMPTKLAEFTLLTPLRPIPDGRADMLYRSQIFTQRIGSLNDIRSWMSELRDVLDHKEYTPEVLGISWSWEFSALDFDRDAQDRVSAAATYHFRGRR